MQNRIYIGIPYQLSILVPVRRGGESERGAEPDELDKDAVRVRGKLPKESTAGKSTSVHHQINSSDQAMALWTRQHNYYGI